MAAAKILTVSDINRYVKNLIARDMLLSNLWVKGELSNFKNHYSGHLYFTLKDEKSLIKCVMFRSQASGLKFLPESGMKVLIRGTVAVFERDGQYQLYVEEMQPEGLGSLYVAFEQLKRKLQQEGLFDENRKKKLPFIPRSVGVITSSTGAAVRDVIHVLTRRFHNVNVKVYPVQVQGEQAAGQVAGALKRLNQLDCVDVIIVTRGGGSLEELWAFNEEVVARSIYESHIPVISAVGHETDFTISDFAADVRAPTPSAAAEIVMPEKRVLENTIKSLNIRLRNASVKKIGMERLAMQKLMGSVVFKQPLSRVYQERMRLDIQNKYLQKAYESCMEGCRNRLSLLAARLDSLSPLNSMARGYSIVRSKKDDTLIKSVLGVNIGDRLEINVQDGKIDCTVEEARGEEK